MNWINELIRSNAWVPVNIAFDVVIMVLLAVSASLSFYERRPLAGGIYLASAMFWLVILVFNSLALIFKG